MAIKIKYSILVVSLLIFFSIGSAAAVVGGFVSKIENGYEIFLNPEKPEAGQALVVAFRPVSGKDTANEQFPEMTFKSRTFQLEPVSGGWRGVVAVGVATKRSASRTGCARLHPRAPPAGDLG